MQLFTIVSTFALAAGLVSAGVPVKNMCITTCSDGYQFTESCGIRYIQDPCVAKKHGTTTLVAAVPEDEPQCKTTCDDGFSFVEACNIDYFQDPCTAQGHGSTSAEK
ncbi:hypothetical protein EDC01DRAFT_653250 [Geopyxis carbonaria]|nr:hypothetical protein EDC01DRAFT_653250 [Geopyxis carbonaria]